MDVVQFLLVLAVLVAAVAVISAPLRRRRADGVGVDSEEDVIAALEVAREAKYREIREAELDLRTGKLSQEDWEAIDGQLRAEAIGILRELDRARDALRRPGHRRNDHTTS